MKHTSKLTTRATAKKTMALILVASFFLLCSITTPRGEELPARPANANFQYPHALVKRIKVGSGSTSCVIFEPAMPQPQSAPLVYFTHGYMAINPLKYEGWINHLVRSGNIVIYATYQHYLSVDISAFNANFCKGIRAGLDLLNSEGHVRPQENLTFAVGHSMGGLLSDYLTTNAAELGFPVPRACFCVEPGGFIENDALKLPKQTLFVSLYGSDDGLVGSKSAILLFEKYRKDAPDRTALIEMLSDNHGEPPLIANHFSPLSIPTPKWYMPASGTKDAHDSGFLWKMFDRLREEAIKPIPDLRNALVFAMPKWSDGMEITPPRITFGDGSMQPTPAREVMCVAPKHKSDTCVTQLVYLPKEPGPYPSVICVVDDMESQLERLAIKQLLSAVAARGFICEYMEIVEQGELDITSAITWALEDHAKYYGELDEPVLAAWGIILNSGAIKHAEFLLPSDCPPACGVVISTGYARTASRELDLCNWLIVGDRRAKEQANRQEKLFLNLGIKTTCHKAWTDRGGMLAGLGNVGDDATATALAFLVQNIIDGAYEVPDPHLLR